jgi:anti-anti-sigma factor
MSVELDIRGNAANITLSGNVDYSTQDEIRNANRQALSNKDVQEIRVDFGQVNFLDSSVIRSLLILQKEAGASGKSLVLLNCSASTRELFEIGGFDRMFVFG